MLGTNSPYVGASRWLGDIYIDTCAGECQVNFTFWILHSNQIWVFFKHSPEKASGGFPADFTKLLILLMQCPICGKEFGEIFQL